MHTTLPSCLYIFFIPVSFISQQSKKWSRSKQHWNWSYWTTCTPYAAISTQSFGLSASTCYTTLLSFFLSKCTVGLWFHGITQKVFQTFKKKMFFKKVAWKVAWYQEVFLSSKICQINALSIFPLKRRLMEPNWKTFWD